MTLNLLKIVKCHAMYTTSYILREKYDLHNADSKFQELLWHWLTWKMHNILNSNKFFFQSLIWTNWSEHKIDISAWNISGNIIFVLSYTNCFLKQTAWLTHVKGAKENWIQMLREERDNFQPSHGGPRDRKRTL